MTRTKLEAVYQKACYALEETERKIRLLTDIRTQLEQCIKELDDIVAAIKKEKDIC